MAKKCLLQRNIKRIMLNKKYFFSRKNILSKIITNSTSLELNIVKLNIIRTNFFNNQKIQQISRDSSKVRLRAKCWGTGKSRGFYRFFGLCRNTLREFAHDCFLPGLTKSSW